MAEEAGRVMTPVAERAVAHLVTDSHEASIGFVRRYIFSTDHKIIGIQYILTGLVMALAGALLATLIRRVWISLGLLTRTGLLPFDRCVRSVPRIAEGVRSDVRLVG